MAKFIWAGESHLLVEFGRELNPVDNKKVHCLADNLSRRPPEGFVECIPAFGSLLISFDPLRLTGDDLIGHCRSLLREEGSIITPTPIVVEIPVLYGGEQGPDLCDVAEATGLSEDDVVKIHTATPYLIYMMGFMPGYPYLGGLDSRIGVPRLKTPRTKVPAGSVAIAERLTGIYSVESPGGWRLIGRTPVAIYMPRENPPALLRAGQYVRFCAIDAKEYALIDSQSRSGTFVPNTYPLKEEVQL